MLAPDLTRMLPAADGAATGAPPAGAAEAPAAEVREAFEQLLDSIDPPPVSSDDSRGDLRRALEQRLESVDPDAVDAEEPEARALLLEASLPSALPSAEPGLALPGVSSAPPDIPAPEPVSVGIGRPAAPPSLAAAAPNEAVAHSTGDALRASPAALPSEAVTLQPQHAGAADAARAPVDPESHEVISRPNPVPAPAAEAVARSETVLAPVAEAAPRPKPVLSTAHAPESRAREATTPREVTTAPVRIPEGVARLDPAMTAGAGRNDAIARESARTDSSATRPASDQRIPSAATPRSEPAPTEVPTAAADREVPDPVATALRSSRDAVRPPTESHTELANPAPLSTTPIIGPPSIDPPIAPAAQTPAAGSPAEAIPLHAEWLAARGGGTVRLRLHPPELGEVELSVRVRGSAVQVSIRTEVAEAGRAAIDGRELLVEALASRELRVEQLVVRSPDGVSTSATPGDSENGSSEHLSEHREGSSERDASHPRSRQDAAPPEPPPEEQPRQSSSAVDLRI